MATNLKRWLSERFRPATLGERGERQAARHLRRKKYKIVATRRRLRYGEIDIVAVDGTTIVFVEVKTRRSETGPRPALAVDDHRRRRMTRAATAFLKSHGLLEYPARFDIVEVVWPAGRRRPTIVHHQNAFPAEGRGQFFR
jgi:putative endonuclease